MERSLMIEGIWSLAMLVIGFVFGDILNYIKGVKKGGEIEKYECKDGFEQIREKYGVSVYKYTRVENEKGNKGFVVGYQEIKNEYVVIVQMDDGTGWNCHPLHLKYDKKIRLPNEMPSCYY